MTIPGAEARTTTRLARMAEASNVSVWIGDPFGGSSNSDDCYVTTASAAAAGATKHVRIGAFLSLQTSGTPLRLAEDIGVVDQASSGRLELGLVAPATDRASWEMSARDLLGAWTHWPILGDRSVAAIPGPAQPWMPRVVVGRHDDADLADRLQAGLMLLGDADPPQTADPREVAERRVILAVPVPGAVREWLEDDVTAAMLDLRARADQVGAQEVLVLLTDADGSRLEDDVHVLGVVLGTNLRCPAHKVEFLAPDTWRWLTELTHLH